MQQRLKTLAQQTNPPVLRVRADKKLSYGRVIELMVIKQNKLSRISQGVHCPIVLNILQTNVAFVFLWFFTLLFFFLSAYFYFKTCAPKNEVHVFQLTEVPQDKSKYTPKNTRIVEENQ